MKMAAISAAALTTIIIGVSHRQAYHGCGVGMAWWHRGNMLMATSAA